MSATLFALALFACSDDATVCQRLDAPVQTYANKAECSAQLDEALRSDIAMKADAPAVYAQCLGSREISSLGKGSVDLSRLHTVQFANAH